MGGYRLNPLEIQPAKIHCPPARDDTLSRARLNSWLERAVSGRLGLIVAEAGFGKTTLLADWARHTKRQTTWYRLESDDRDWLTFIRHLVAGGRELDPEFASETFRLLQALGPGGPTPGDLTASIAREMAAFGEASRDGLTLLLDDFHVVDGDPDTDPIVRALLDRTGPGFSVVIATRSMPRFSVGRLRARGGVMTIDGQTLCFDMDETSRLFRDAYRRPLDADVVTDLHDRTEGWPALLTLVRTGLEDRESSDPRTLVAHLHASRGDLYEFLADEVMGSLSPELQHFLTRVSVLMAVDLESAMLVDDRPADAVADAIRESERLGLLTRPDRESPHRFHNLVREFLLARLTSEIGEEAVRAVHRSIADRVRDTDWYAAASHYLMAGDANNCSEVVDGALDDIIASGMFDQVRPFLGPRAGDPERPAAVILRIRVELAHGNALAAEELAANAVTGAAEGSHRGLALLSLMTATWPVGLTAEAVPLALAALQEDLSPSLRGIAKGSVAISQASRDGDLVAISDALERLGVTQREAGQSRYAAITSQNRGTILAWIGRTSDAYTEAARAESLLGGLSNRSYERVGATSLRAVARAIDGQLGAAREIVANAAADGSSLARNELLTESARLEVDFGSLDVAFATLLQIDDTSLVTGHRELANLVHAQVAIRRGDPAVALKRAEQLAEHPCVDAAGRFRAELVHARAAVALGRHDGIQLAVAARDLARRQRSGPCEIAASFLVAVAGGDVSLDDLVLRPSSEETWAWSLVAEEVVAQLDRMSGAAFERVWDEATRRPERWSTAARLAIGAGDVKRPRVASLLAEIGGSEDAVFLRSAAGARKWLRPYAARVARRLALPVMVVDLGVVDVLLGGESVKRKLRRKVLALLCYLSSRPAMASSRDEALEALWPDLSPTAGSNSLHQAIYYLRRVFEPGYREGVSAEYIQFDGDVISLDPDLLHTASRMCWSFVGTSDDGDAIDNLVATYSGKYALDFAYEDWATDYRESLHAAVLAATEGEVRRSRLAGEYDRSARLAHAMLSVDPIADAIELELVLAYRASGRRAAAAEQYAHYAAFVRGELGLEPRRLEDL